MKAATSGKFNWEEVLRQDRDVQLMEAFVQRSIAKLPGQAPPRADAGRGGSRYQPAPPAPAVKAEQRPAAAMGTTSNGSVADSSSSGASTPHYIDYRDYQSSSSEVDTREVNPMDELSDFESDSQQLEQLQEEDQDQDQSMDVEMEEQDAAEAKEQEAVEDRQKEPTVCEVCRSSEREADIVLCDDCDAEFHIFCLQPPLPDVPEGRWYCPKCHVKYPAATAVSVKKEQTRAAAVSSGVSDSAGAGAAPVVAMTEAATADTGASDVPPPSGNAPVSGADGSDATSIPIAQALEGDPEKSNLLLVHACNCDEFNCVDPEFQVFCPHMKRFLRSVCWASHSDKWRSYRLARITAELFAYHAMNCQLPQCNVPLCVKIREEEIV